MPEWVELVRILSPTLLGHDHRKQDISTNCTHYSIWDLPGAIEGVPFVPYQQSVAPLSLIEETLHGRIWSLISPVLTTNE